ncbi:hypothetical protein QAD02_006624 [Eretmocerus hayati]|uniref:Uncharacterized protein n=1 Tax=Eretmocerus hayati TaxID=131215 RepID=A0ACC2N3Q3_9HYME|nr:hypothetical protein QAD02_006624 [Eretmocerus hayati]
MAQKYCPYFILIVIFFLAFEIETTEALLEGIKILQKLTNNILSLASGSVHTFAEIFRYNRNEQLDFTPDQDEEFDFIIVGSGSAGSVLAARLSEVENVRVLLLEAGGHERWFMDIPLIALFLQYYRAMHWDYWTEPSDTYCLGFNNHQCRVPMGKVMGGSSTINAMMATRGSKKDYDEWARMSGDSSWSFSSMLKYFKRLEFFDVHLDELEVQYHNFNGPVRITDVPYRTRYVHSWVKAGAELGFPPRDYDGRKSPGLNYLQTNQINGQRLSANRAYLHPIKNRENLVVSMFSHVDRILIDQETKVAYGVEFTKKGKKIRVRASKEVIVSAGPINSPKLLMLSGIGPRQHLESHGIPVIADLPVGENLQDHIILLSLNFFANGSEGIQVFELLNPTNTQLANYLNNRKGPLSVPTGIEGIGFLNVDDPTAEDTDPNLELLFGNILPNCLIYEVLGLTRDQYLTSFAGVDFHHGYFIWPMLLQPKSRGRILLTNSNPESKPKIIAGYFEDKDDIRVMIEGIKWSLKISETEAMKEIGSTLVHKPVLGCEHFKMHSDQYWECVVRTQSMSIYHWSGACKMGAVEDPTAVVDTKLRVKGIERLRVVGASIMPKVISGHPNIPTIAIGEKSAEDIKCEWGFISC